MSIIIDGKVYYGIIYKIENIISHKIYIGQTTLPKGFSERYSGMGTGIEKVYNYYTCNKKRGAYCNEHLMHSIEKYGFDSFVVDEIYDIAESKEDLDSKEIYYIEKFNCIKNGYNISEGGDSFKFGYTGEKCSNSKRVYQLSIDGKLIRIWNSCTEASNELHIPASSISNVCNGKKIRKGGAPARTAGGYVWVFEKDYDPNKDYSLKTKKKCGGRNIQEILLLSDDGGIIQEFESLHDASRVLGINVESVRKICMHKIKKPRYNLMYKSEYMEEQRLSEKGYIAEAV